MQPKFTHILRIPFEPLSFSDAQARIVRMLESHKSATVYTPNPAFLARAQKEPHLASLLRSADLLLPDGVGITLAARLKGTPLGERIAGIDMAEWILSYAAQKGYSVFLLGGEPGVAESAKESLCQRIAGLRICGTHHGYFNKYRESADNRQILAKIRKASPHILFVCFGFPAQEQWIAENAASLPSLRLSMGLGGSLDVWSGKIPRAPRILRKCGMEWVWRTLREPRRIPTLLQSIKPLILFLTQKEKETNS